MKQNLPLAGGKLWRQTEISSWNALSTMAPNRKLQLRQKALLTSVAWWGSSGFICNSFNVQSAGIARCISQISPLTSATTDLFNSCSLISATKRIHKLRSTRADLVWKPLTLGTIVWSRNSFIHNKSCFFIIQSFIRDFYFLQTRD